MSRPVFRFATIEDVDQLTHLRILMQSEVSGNDPAAVKADYRKKVRDYFSEELRSGNLIGAVAELDQELIAANGVVVYKKPPSILSNSATFGYVTNVYTRPDWRGKGIAKTLLEMVISDSRTRKIDKLHLSSTEIGLPLYKNMGFIAPHEPQLELRFKEKN
jgi:ribosomal protein S18 acetylase RimI-like enzyme